MFNYTEKLMKSSKPLGGHFILWKFNICTVYTARATIFMIKLIFPYTSNNGRW